MSNNEILSEIYLLKHKLNETDYKIIKCAELGQPVDPSLAALRQTWRNEINALQAQLIL